MWFIKERNFFIKFKKKERKTTYNDKKPSRFIEIMKRESQFIGLLSKRFNNDLNRSTR